MHEHCLSRHDEINKMSVRPAKTQISLGIRPVWSVIAVRSMGSLGPKLLIRLGGCPGWCESLLGAQPFCWFCHVAAQMRLQTLSSDEISLKRERSHMNQISYILVSSCVARMNTDAWSMSGEEDSLDIRNRLCMWLWLNPFLLLEPIVLSIPEVISQQR